MAEPLGARQLLDEALTATVGPIDADTADAIVRICNEAAETARVSIFTSLAAEPERLRRIVPWVRDLAQGLHYRSHHGPGEPTTAELLGNFSAQRLAPEELQRFAETVDLTTVLTLDRLLEPILGPGASARDPRDHDAAPPWLASLNLGYRIYLVLELLRLLPLDPSSDDP